MGIVKNTIFVMLSLSKHLYRFVEKPLNGAVEMLRQAQYDPEIENPNTL
ncbi:hypothetical protein Q5H89_19140 [Hymenobacter sp. CA2-7]|nr:hypothetical protein [Hymenobacter sp. CA2-7]